MSEATRRRGRPVPAARAQRSPGPSQALGIDLQYLDLRPESWGGVVNEQSGEPERGSSSPGPGSPEEPGSCWTTGIDLPTMPPHSGTLLRGARLLHPRRPGPTRRNRRAQPPPVQLRRRQHDCRAHCGLDGEAVARLHGPRRRRPALPPTSAPRRQVENGRPSRYPIDSTDRVPTWLRGVDPPQGGGARRRQIRLSARPLEPWRCSIGEAIPTPSLP